MNRRSFLKLFATAGPAAVVAPTYFFAPVGGWHSDVIFHPADPTSHEDVIAAQEASRMYYRGKNGIYENGSEGLRPLSVEIPPVLWGLPYWQVRPPYLSDTYLGISRS